MTAGIAHSVEEISFSFLRKAAPMFSSETRRGDKENDIRIGTINDYMWNTFVEEYKFGITLL